MWTIRARRAVGGVLGRLGVCFVIGGGMCVAAWAVNQPTKADPSEVALGYELFTREWLPGDARAHGGDGLGPVYNDTSCVACHNSGGSGGGGPTSKNIDLLSAGLSNAVAPLNVDPSGPPEGPRDPAAEEAARLLEKLFDHHAGFRSSRTVVLHKFGTDPNYDAWRQMRQQGQMFAGALALPPLAGPVNFAVASPFEPPASSVAAPAPAAVPFELLQNSVTGNVGPFLVSHSQRNPTALFGLGLIDAIPAKAIEDAAGRQAVDEPVRGRVSRLKDGRIGRLGWKGQTASAEDFVLNACSVEMGLEVPGRPQAVSPQAPRYQPPGLDLTARECAALVSYVRSLPRPLERPAADEREAKTLASGKALFTKVGCAKCHTPSLGDVDGLYSDLLLHDMGPELADLGSYSDSSGSDGGDEPLLPLLEAQIKNGPTQPPAPPQRRTGGATRQEWRTPPLWGFRDSSPYLHDGRAQTLEQAVAQHGGQGNEARQAFQQRPLRDRLAIEAFLKSLVAPPSNTLAQAQARGTTN
jgi:CxxC motif-containing protein (DUF1111 family)